MAIQTEIFPQYSQSLFSNNYLQHHLPKITLWNNNEEKIRSAFMEISQVYQNLKELNLGPGEEANLEDKFIRPVLKALGYEWDVQPTTQRGPKKKRPDYALFKDTASYKEGRKDKEDLKRFFSQALTILEAKYWGRRLNDTDVKDTLDARDPTAQTVKYLDDVYHASNSRIQWAILTNGKEWRLFYYHATSRVGNFYEVDLETTIIKNDLNAFRYFYFFFARDAFIPDTLTSKSWLGQHLEGSEAYAIRVSEKLKNLIFDQVFEGLATGFIEYRRNELGIKNETEGTLKEIFNGCLTLLYRLLFLLYAESRNLLPVEDQNRYYKKSLKKLKEDIVKDLGATGLEGMSHRAYDYWSRLESLCRIIDKGDHALNIPIYNGGLFQTPPESFLATHKLADPYLAEAIELLTVDQEGDHAPGSTAFIDYSSLGVRHLGDVYEGLLEFHVRVAEKEMVEVKEKGRSIWKSKEDAGKTHSSHMKRVKRSGEVYIENIKHERRATGSYYTPHYIVEYIVKNTVGPILDERFKKAEGILSDLEGLYKKQRKQLGKKEGWKHWEHPGEPKSKYIEEIIKKEQELFNTLFDIKVLDPAMGSGHFLVHTVDFIADKLITFLAKYPDNPVIAQIESMKQQILENVAKQNVEIDESRLTEVNLIKRMVMKKCIHGVDINDMAVELAKLSLWLDSFTLGAPLSFLNHHLKCGNSLIGISVSEVKEKLQATLFGSQFAGLLSATELMRQVGELTDATFEDIQRSVTLYERADQTLKPFKRILDLWLSEHFGNEGAQKFLTHGGDVQSLLKDINELEEKDQRLVFEAERLKREKRFFHWQLEFPESFYDATHEKENPGFDAVIGNPPYINAIELNKILSEFEKPFWKTVFRSASGAYDLYILFLEQAVNLTRPRSYSSLITPNKFLSAPYAYGFREYIKSTATLVRFLDLSIGDVFNDPSVYPIVSIIQKTIPINEYSIMVERPRYKHNIQDTVLIEHSSASLGRLPEAIWGFLISKHLTLILKADQFSTRLEQCATVHASSTAAEADAYEDALSDSTCKDCKMFINTGLIDRYDVLWGAIPLTHKGAVLKTPYLRLNHPNVSHERRSQYEKPKIIFAKMALRIEAFVDNQGAYASANTNFAYDSKYDLNYLASLFNSEYLSLIYGEYFGALRMSGGYFQFQAPQLRVLPIRKIDFTTSKTERQRRVKEVTIFYGSGAIPKVLAWVETEITSDRTDTVHDLLAYLAEGMAEMNNQKQRLIKKFLSWLGKEIVKGPIAGLKNKTKVEEFHDHPVNTLVEVLKGNKCIANPAPSKILNLIEREFEDVMAKLSPLKDKIKNTDQLIDQIVYKLYGLTQEKIQVIEGTIAVKG